MANPEHLELLRQGVEVWNAWRAKEPSVRPDLNHATSARRTSARADLRDANLSHADLSRANITEADLVGANLSGADLSGANLSEANLSGANLSGANLSKANLSEANLSRADLSEANLSEANLFRRISAGEPREANLCYADLSGANLRGANLSRAILVETSLVDAILTDCRIYGISAWNVKLSDENETARSGHYSYGEPEVTTDDLEVAQFIYLLLHNEKLQRVIDTITSKVVLILGRFSLPERKQVLDALRDELRNGATTCRSSSTSRSRGARTTINTDHAACAHGAVCDRRHLRRQERAAGACRRSCQIAQSFLCSRSSSRGRRSRACSTPSRHTLGS